MILAIPYWKRCRSRFIAHSLLRLYNERDSFAGLRPLRLFNSAIKNGEDAGPAAHRARL
jgi:hypothetical protein